ncbi:MAG: alpha/beta hydrolase [Clostridiaceae bacterium]|nr:alpha/beta hydrolase [Clostridiaceae bacterium]
MTNIVTKERFAFPSKLDNKMIHAVIYRPEKEVKGLVQVIHGFAEHIGRYEKFMTLLAEQGYVAFGTDHLGHGLTAENESELSDVGSYSALDPMLADQKEINQIVRRQYDSMNHSGYNSQDDSQQHSQDNQQYDSRIPCIILGHSMGSLMLRGLLIRYPDICDKAIIMGTGDNLPILLRIFSLILALFKAFKPGNYRSPFINYLGVGKYNSSFKPKKTNNDWLSENPENVSRYIKDPYCGALGTLHTYDFLLKLMTLIRKPHELAKMQKDLPVLFVSGEQDAFGGFGKGVNLIVQLFKKAGMQNVKLILYPGMRHEILKGKDHNQVIRDILDFIEK